MKLPVLSKKGFTLVELMIVIAIIAILTVIGVVVYQGQQKNARDTRRSSDIQAIAQSLEAQKQPGQINYPVLAPVFFSSQKIPVDPTNTIEGTDSVCPGVCQYCFTLSATPISDCPASGGSYISSETADPSGWSASPTWTVCANLESGKSFCRSNTQ